MEEPVPALERMAGFVEETGHRHGIEYPLQMTLGISDGDRLWAIRYSSEGHGRTRSLWTTIDAASVRALAPDNEIIQRMRDDDRIVVSEPLGGLPGMWQEVPEATALVIQDGPDEVVAFQPTTALSSTA
jgi:glutamine amidotransferase